MLLSGEACGGKARGRSDVGNSARVPEGQQEPAGPRPRNALFAGFTATMAKSDFPGGLLGLTLLARAGMRQQAKPTHQIRGAGSTKARSTNRDCTRSSPCQRSRLSPQEVAEVIGKRGRSYRHL